MTPYGGHHHKGHHHQHHGGGGGGSHRRVHTNNNTIYVKKSSATSKDTSCSNSSSSDEGSGGGGNYSLDQRRGLVYSGLVLLCTVVYWNALGCDFVFDDITAIVENKDLRPHVPLRNLLANDFWGTPMSKEQSHKSYRPLTVLTFRWNYWLGETDPLGYHLVNVLLHGLVTALFFKVCYELLSSISSRGQSRSQKRVVVAALLFALHPIHTEAVTGVVGRAELLASLAYLSALLAFQRAAHKNSKATRWTYLLATLAATVAATLCKEQGVTVVAVCIVFELCVRNNFHHGSDSRSLIGHAIKRIGVLILGLIVILLARIRLMGATLPVFTRFDNPASAANTTSTKVMTFSYLASLNLWLLLAPCDLLCDWTMQTVPLVSNLTDLRNLVTLLLFIVVLLFLRLILTSWTSSLKRKKKKSALCSLGLAMTVFPFIPASNLFFPVGFVVAERVLYLPSMGFCLLLALGWEKMERKNQVMAKLGLALLCSLFAAKTVVRNWDWRDELSIFSSGLKITHSNAKLLNNVGHALESQAQYQRALRYYQKAIQVQPDDIGGHIHVGRVYNHLKRYSEAEEAYLYAKALLPQSRSGESYQARVAPNHLNVFLNLATLIAKNGSRLEEADMLYRQAISMRSDYTEAYINRGDILLRLNRTQEAKEVYQKALGFENDNPDLLYNMGVVLLSQGQQNEAMAYLNKALEYDPDHHQALLNSAVLIQESGSSHLNHVARERLLRLVAKGVANERVYFNLGMLAMDDAGKDLAAAENWFRKAVQVQPDFRSALFNLALLLSESDRPLQAEPVLHQLLGYYPNHVKGLILLGDLYVNHRNDLRSAEKCYRRILDMEPNNIQARHNLCVVILEAGDLSSARECLERVSQLAPSEGYINKHLHIVEERLRQKMLSSTQKSSFEDKMVN